MKRFRRWLFTWLAVLSFLLCAIICCLSLTDKTPAVQNILSVHTPDNSVWRFTLSGYWIHIAHIHPWPLNPQSFFRIRCCRIDLRQRQPPHWEAEWSAKPFYYLRGNFNWFSGSLSLAKLNPSNSNPKWDSLILFPPWNNAPHHPISSIAQVSIWRIDLPAWTIVLALGVPPFLRVVFVVRYLVRKRRMIRGHCCPACGYDLRATPDRCPECGTVPPKP